jgi:quinol monooxygenase YgiN
MIVRIVKMTFNPERVPDFLNLFDQYKEAIANQPGCTHLELLAQPEQAIFFTYSHWLSENHLNQYRNSDTFGVVWPQTKALFKAAPEAWTLHVAYDSQT